MAGAAFERIRERRAKVRQYQLDGLPVAEIATLLGVTAHLIYRDLTIMDSRPNRPAVRTPRRRHRKQDDPEALCTPAYHPIAAMAAGVCVRHPDRPAVTTGSDIPLCAECDEDTRLAGGANEYTHWRGRHSVAWEVERSR